MVRRSLSICLWSGLCLWLSPAFADPASSSKWLDQGWSTTKREQFYSLSQGSQLMPYEWFIALDIYSSNVRFKDTLPKSYGLLPRERTKKNPDRLPIGFVEDKDKYGRWIGINCAACHTARLTYGKKEMFVDGGSADYNALQLAKDLNKSLVATRDEPKRFSKFAKRVLGADAGKSKEKLLLKSFSSFTKQYGKFVSSIDEVPDWGAGRVDAFGAIFNRIGVDVLGDMRNAAKPNAPVNFPHLWGTYYHDFAQWNASFPSGTFWTALVRNVGQVLGNYGKMQADVKVSTLGLPSTVRRLNIVRLEKLLKSLRPPAWPQNILGAIDQSKAQQGKLIYQARCANCHTLLEEKTSNKLINVSCVPIEVVKTDPMMASNFRDRRLFTGPLAGISPVYSERFETKESAESVISKVVAGVVAGTFLPIQYEEKVKRNSVLQSESIGIKNLSDSQAPIARYKARPLEGIWATAPFLHNGSVASLYELLLPAAERTKVFPVGSGAFDPTTVGVDLKQAKPPNFLDTTVPGNSNSGHEFTTDLEESERLNLLEFLKTL